MTGADKHERRLAWVLVAVAIGVGLAYFANNLLTAALADKGIWTLLDPLPRLAPTGADFLHGMYQPARELMRTGNPYTLPLYSYPPLVSVMSIPIALLPYRTAYIVQIVLLLVTACAAVALVADSARVALRHSHTVPPRLANGLAVGVAVLTALLMVTGYGFGFALERGNYDSYAILLSALAVRVMVADRRGAGILATVLVALATGLKIYPAILFAVIVWRYGWKYVFAIAGAVAATLLAAGPANALRFAGRITEVVGNGVSYWIGNHSASSFAMMLQQALGYPAPAVGRVLLALPVLVWLVGAALVFRLPRNPAGLVGFSALSVPVMSLVPTVSHDYKLVILYPVLAYALVSLGARFVRTGGALHASLVTAVLALGALLSRSPVYTSGVFLQNKYPAVLALECLLLYLLATAPHEARGPGSERGVTGS